MCHAWKPNTAVSSTVATLAVPGTHTHTHVHTRAHFTEEHHPPLCPPPRQPLSPSLAPQHRSHTQSAPLHLIEHLAGGHNLTWAPIEPSGSRPLTGIQIQGGHGRRRSSTSHLLQSPSRAPSLESVLGVHHGPATSRIRGHRPSPTPKPCHLHSPASALSPHSHTPCEAEQALSPLYSFSS